MNLSYMIHETTDEFPFSKLLLCKPISNSGGNFFIRYSINEQPLYIQPPKCYIKQIHTKSGKKMYSDLVFQQENEAFIRWMENLENKTQQLLFEHRSEWFQTDLEKEDIEQSFTSPMKIYKSGKEYIVRTNIPSRGGVSSLKIYDEEEKTIPIENIHENTKVMVILEIQGVRSSARSFQIDIEIKQMMVLKPEEIFNTCIFKSRPKNTSPLEQLSINKILLETNDERRVDNERPVDERQVDNERPVDNERRVDNERPADNEESVISKETENKDIIIPTLVKEDPDSLCEVDFNLDEMTDSDTICLKERKDMYYQMYQEARQKAKVARDLALSAYLEAKQIKNKYLLDDVLDSSSDESTDLEENDDPEPL